MGKIVKTPVLAVAAFAVLAVVYFLLRGISAWRQGYAWQEMDWDQDGHTSISEFFAASDIGKREVQRDGKTCTEYYAYKDALPVKLACPK